MLQPDPLAQAAPSVVSDASRPATVIVFGSHARGDAAEASELDRVVIEAEPLDKTAEYLRLKAAAGRIGVGVDRLLFARPDFERRLQLTQEGESEGKSGYDIFVRRKPIAQRPIGCNPGLNDGVRLDIRPSMIPEVPHHRPKLNITWDKDRGKDVQSAPWFEVFKSERINDHHLTPAEKKAVRAKA